MNISSWLIRLTTWDGVLPAAIWSVPFLVSVIVPQSRTAIELTAVILPIIAFFIRYQVGSRYILSNALGAILQRIQIAAFCLGILVLLLIDAVMVLTHVMPEGAVIATNADLIAWLSIYSIYLAAMAVAMYPGSHETHSCSGDSTYLSRLY